MREGSDLRNQMCATGAASSIWPMRSRRTRDNVTSTEHFSQMMPLYFIRLDLRQRNSRSFIGETMVTKNGVSGSWETMANGRGREQGRAPEERDDDENRRRQSVAATAR